MFFKLSINLKQHKIIINKNIESHLFTLSVTIVHTLFLFIYPYGVCFNIDGSDMIEILVPWVYYYLYHEHEIPWKRKKNEYVCLHSKTVSEQQLCSRFFTRANIYNTIIYSQYVFTKRIVHLFLVKIWNWKYQLAYMR